MDESKIIIPSEKSQKKTLKTNNTLCVTKLIYKSLKNANKSTLTESTSVVAWNRK